MDQTRRLGRRDFVKSALAAAAAPMVIPSAADGAAGGARPAPSNRITMALIGCGGMGASHLGAFLRMPDVQMLAG